MRQWDLDTISNIMMVCIIMHNMFFKDKRDLQLEPILDCRSSEGNMRLQFSFRDLQSGTREIEDIGTRYALRTDLVEHLWRLKEQGRA